MSKENKKVKGTKVYGLTTVKALLWGPNNRVILTSYFLYLLSYNEVLRESYFPIGLQ